MPKNWGTLCSLQSQQLLVHLFQAYPSSCLHVCGLDFQTHLILNFQHQEKKKLWDGSLDSCHKTTTMSHLEHDMLLLLLQRLPSYHVTEEDITFHILLVSFVCWVTLLMGKYKTKAIRKIDFLRWCIIDGMVSVCAAKVLCGWVSWISVKHLGTLRLKDQGSQKYTHWNLLFWRNSTAEFTAAPLKKLQLCY